MTLKGVSHPYGRTVYTRLSSVPILMNTIMASERSSKRILLNAGLTNVNGSLVHCVLGSCLSLSNLVHIGAFCFMIRAHSFPRPAEFRADRVIWGFFRGIEPRNNTVEFFFSADLDVFHSNNYFFTENDLKVALLQVCL